MWLELEEHFGESNGPLIYQLQRQIASISQGDSSLSKYYTNLKQLWDQLNSLVQIPSCTCSSAKAISDHNSSTRLMQFLMGLNDTYDSLRNQILVLDPLPSVYKAYSMALSVEKQREVQINFANPTEVSAMLARTPKYSNNTKKSFQIKKNFEQKGKINSDKYCDHCKSGGHTKDVCFKLHGYPDWYKELKEKKKFGSNSAHMANTSFYAQSENPLHEVGENVQPTSANPNNDESLNNLFQQFTQFLKNNQHPDTHFANLSHFGDFAGMNISLFNSIKTSHFDVDTWILDTGATAHMCAQLSSIGHPIPVSNYTPIFLPDGSIKSVTHTGLITLNSRVVLKNVLYVPQFTCNLLSVKALATSANIAFTFLPVYCVLQDLQTAKIIGIGKVMGNLYVLNKFSLESANIESILNSCNLSKNLKFNFCNVAHFKNKECYSIWHKRLGHSSESVLSHLTFIPKKSIDESLPCIPCHLAKQQRIPFHVSDSCVDSFLN